MYKPIQLSDHRKIKLDSILESTSLNIFNEEISIDDQNIFQEAVFTNGKEKLAPILEKVVLIKNELETKIQEQTNNNVQFNPIEYWRSPNMRALEDAIKNLFGVRFVSIESFNEKYVSDKDLFESERLSCYVYSSDRYPIDGIVTDNGFYDQSHSIVMNIHVSLGLIHLLTPEEILAVFLHEIGHNIDPALMTIKYAETNILSKYLTDRNEELNECEKNVEKSRVNIIEKVFKKFRLFNK